MANIVVVFESRYGQAEKIAAHIADLAARHGHEARLLRASGECAGLEEHDAFVIVAPVYIGRHPDVITAFLRTHALLLSARPSAVVSVSNSAASPSPEARANAQAVAERLVEKAGLRPQVIATAGGAFAYPRYGVVTRWFMKAIARKTGGPTDTSKVHELTDWSALDASLVPFFAAPALNPPVPSLERVPGTAVLLPPGRSAPPAWAGSRLA